MGNEEAKILSVAIRTRQAFAEKSPNLFPEHYPTRTAEEYYVKTSAEKTRVLVYRPRPVPAVAPVFVNMHGGGFVQGCAADDGVWCQRIADAAECCVVNIEYHLSPEHKFPVALEECYDIVKWAHDQATELGFDATRIAVGGNSSGGNLAAALCLLARERRDFSVVCQILNFPPLDFSREHFCHEPRDARLTPQVWEFFAACYLRSPEDAKTPLASPLHAPDLSGLPPALLISAEFDPMREEQALFASRLETSGVALEYRCFDGCMHGFTHLGQEPEASEAWELIHVRLRQAFGKTVEKDRPF